VRVNIAKRRTMGMSGFVLYFIAALQ
jgi:hypothetical protein